MSDIFGKLAGAALQNMLGGGARGAGGGPGDSPLAAILAQMLGGGMGASAGGSMGGGPAAAPASRAAPQAGGTGGLSDLLQQFQQAGLGSKADSWVSSGENESVAPEELANVFPPGQVEQWARQAGTDPQSLLAVLSQALPHVVDRMTPHGQVPPAAPQAGGQPGMPDLGAILGGLLGGRR